MKFTPQHILLVICSLRRIVSGLFLFLWIGIALNASAQTRLPEQVRQVLKKEKPTILITDSGLGGLSVCGEIESLAGQTKAFESLNLIFCNALPEANYGYNNIESEEKKAQVFSSALSGMEQTYRPDLILIACNTLSVVYPETEFSKTASVPVLGIVDMGAELLYEKLSKDTASSVVIFGTETTINANSHAKALKAKGISSERIVPEACPELAGEIQNNPNSDMVNSMVDLYVSDAVSLLSASHKKKIYAGLCCTHYGYSKETFLNAFKDSGVSNVEIVNPNETMAQSLFEEVTKNKAAKTEISVSVASRAPLTQDEINAISSLLETNSPKTAQALKQYELNTNLFKFEKEN